MPQHRPRSRWSLRRWAAVASSTAVAVVVAVAGTAVWSQADEPAPGSVLASEPGATSASAEMTAPATTTPAAVDSAPTPAPEPEVAAGADPTVAPAAGVGAAPGAVAEVPAPAGTGQGGAPADSPAVPAPAVSGWLSGASGPGAADGSFAAWRGAPVDIIGTWSDNPTAMVQLWQLQPGGELADWDGPLDIAIGAIGPGETWQAAATGAYDARWRESLTNLRQAWAGRSGQLYVRFAHEMNGNWYPWSVDRSEVSDFRIAWARFRDLQQQLFPRAALVFALNRESVGSGFDWRESFPGAEQVDVLGVDYYNQWPYAGTEADFDRALTLTDQWGAPKGLQGYADFARSQGLPLAVPEWSGVAQYGDSPAYIEGMQRFFAENAGTGPGQVRYEVLFDIDNADYAGDFKLSGSTSLPLSAQAYRRLF